MPGTRRRTFWPAWSRPLRHWNLARGLGRPPSREFDPKETLKVLAPLALWMHETSPREGLVGTERVGRRLRQLYETRGFDDAEADRAARRFLEDVRDFAGLVVERGAGQYGFVHQTFQEYLAAGGLRGGCASAPGAADQERPRPDATER